MTTPAQARKEAARWAQIEKDDPDFALLHYAEIGHLGKVKKLLSAGADANSKQDINTGIETVIDTPLYAAAGAGHMAVAEALIAGGADVDIEADDRWRPLHHAALNGETKMAAMLVGRGADINHREALMGHTPLHIASERGDTDTVRALVQLGADRTLQDHLGRTAADVACQIAGAGRDDTDRKRKKANIHDIFNDAAAADAARARAAHAALGVLQKDVDVAKPVTLRPRRPRAP